MADPLDDDPAADDEQDLLLVLPVQDRPHQRIATEQALDALGDELAEAVAEAGVGEGAGQELTSGECTLFFCGPDTSKLLAVLRPLLKRSPLCRGGHFVRTVRGSDGDWQHQRIPI